MNDEETLLSQVWPVLAAIAMIAAPAFAFAN